MLKATADVHVYFGRLGIVDANVKGHAGWSGSDLLDASRRRFLAPRVNEATKDNNNYATESWNDCVVRC